MAQLFGSYIDSKRKAASKYLQEWQSTAYSMIVFGATLVVMFWVSVFLYTSFYFTYMPQESATWPIHFQYTSCGEKPGICSFPYAIISVTDPTRGSVLARGQKYRVVVDIEMPESPMNQRIGNEAKAFISGMFLINMSMKSHNGEVLRQAARSTMIRYKSELLQTISTLIFSPFLLYGVHEEKQMVTVELFSQYEEDPVCVAGMFLINMSMKSHNGEVLRQAARSTMIRYKSELLQTISTLIFSPFLLYGVHEEKQMVTVELFSQYEEDPYTITTVSERKDSSKLYQASSGVRQISGADPDDEGLQEILRDDEGQRLKADQLPVSERRDSDDFEVVSSSKTQEDGTSSRRGSKLVVSSASKAGSRRGSRVCDVDEDCDVTVKNAGSRRASNVYSSEDDCVIRQRHQVVE
ncbi:uncharacterized protein Seipin [Panulirus ornatus]|uniref:uncharacterized protein Seipin n=1 Tax=Panulirus ornatus TaxID=150431 RepID=UPI003A84A9EA